MNNRNDRVEVRIDDLIAAHRPGWTLERAFYNDPEIYEVELEKIFVQGWLYAGHVSRIPGRGDFFLWEVAGESLIIVRGDNEQVHAFLNICRHRGTRVCQEPSGRAKSFVCSYHQWTYNIDGTLQSARLMPADFDKSQFGLRRAHVRVAEGLIFISLAQDPPDLEPALRDIKLHLEPYELAQAKICHTQEYDIKANWKIVTENFRECYHCAGNHPALCRLMPHIALTSPKQIEEFQRSVASAQTRWEKMGLATRNVPMSAKGYHVMRFAFKEGILTQTMDGQPTAPLLGRLTGTEAGQLAVSVSPNFWIEVSCDYAASWRLTPDGLDRTKVRADWAVRSDAVQGVDYDPDRVSAFWRVTLGEDWGLCEKNQAGVSCRGYQPGPYAPGVDGNSTLGESGPQFFTEWYLRQLTRQRS